MDGKRRKLAACVYVVHERVVPLSAAAFASCHPQRCLLTHSLVASLQLLQPAGPLAVLRPAPASVEALQEYHAKAYTDALAQPVLADCDEEDEPAAARELRLAAGLSHDCPPFAGALEYARLVAGGSLAAADVLMLRQNGQAGGASVAVHWDGGRHHALRSAASGFCYVNDVVLALQRLLSRGFRRVLYVDVDIHHCDAVAGAFARTPAVLTVSMHRREPGFFPGSGSESDVGVGRGAGFSLNLPLKAGLSDATFCAAFDALAAEAAALYRPDATVLCLGADGLAGDPLGGWCLTPAALRHAALTARAWGAPLLLLGGGGYDEANAARAWAIVTAAIAGEEHAAKTEPGAPVPDHAHLLAYGPSFAMWATAGNRSDENERVDVLARCGALVGVLRRHLGGEDVLS